MTRLEALRLLATCVAFVVALLAVFPAPEGNVLWYLAIAATEFGVLLAPLALALAIPVGGGRVSRYISAVAVLAFLLLLSPLMRAFHHARDPGTLAVSAAFPDPPREGPDSPASTAPFSLGRLVHLRVGGFSRRTESFTGAAGQAQVADVSEPLGAEGPRPLVVVVHGGSWSGGDQTQLAALNGYLAARGHTVVALTYRLAPTHPFPAALDDVVAGVRWAQSLPKVDPGRTVLLGRSAGGHLALLAATHIEGLRGVVALYAPNDLVWSWNHPRSPWVLDTPGTLRAFLGGPLDTHRARFDAASPLLRADALPPTLLIHGTRDELVSAEQSRRLAKRLAELGTRHAFLELPWATHGLDASLRGPGGQASTWAIERFLASVTGGG
jgi:acetyl esterase/lipase